MFSNVKKIINFVSTCQWFNINSAFFPPLIRLFFMRWVSEFMFYTMLTLYWTDINSYFFTENIFRWKETIKEIFHKISYSYSIFIHSQENRKNKTQSTKKVPLVTRMKLLGRKEFLTELSFVKRIWNTNNGKRLVSRLFPLFAISRQSHRISRSPIYEIRFYI